MMRGPGLTTLAVTLLLAAALARARADVSVMASDEHGVVLGFEFGPAELQAVPGTSAQVVNLAGCYRREVADEPDLPQLELLCGVSQVGGVTVTAEVEAADDLSGVSVAPAPRWRSSSDAPGAGNGRADGIIDFPDYRPGPVYAENRLWPAEVAVLEEVGVVRSVRVARVLISPVQYNPQQRVLRVARRGRIRVGFEKPARKTDVAGQDPFEGSYPEMLVNGSTARSWKIAADRVDGPLQKAGSFFDRSGAWVKVVVESTGVYRVAHEDLARIGARPEFIDPRTFRMYTPGVHDPTQYYADSMYEIPLVVTGEADSSFDRDDFLLFFGRAISEWDAGFRTFFRNLYTDCNVYWLTWGSGPGLRMGRGLGDPMPREPRSSTGYWTSRVEQDLVSPERAGLLWVWRLFEKQSGVPEGVSEFDLQLASPLAVRRLSGRMYSNNSSTNRLRIELNGRVLDSAAFRDRPYTLPFELDLSYDSTACPGDDSLSSRLSLRLVGDSAMQVYVDWFEVRYEKRLRLDRFGAADFFSAGTGPMNFTVRGMTGSPLVLNVTDPDRPRLILGAFAQGDSIVFRDVLNDTSVYHVTELERLRRPRSLERREPGRLRSPGFAADYVIVAPEHMFAAAQVLERFRANNVPGMPTARARTVRLTEVYDDYSFGRAEPIGIRGFLAATRPVYAVLIGDATVDYRDNLKLRPLPGVPAWATGFYLPQGGYGSPAAARDAWYADFDGDGFTPDLMLGRLTTRTPEELRGFIDKLVRFEQGGVGSWCRRAILLADDEWLGFAAPGYEDRIGVEHVTDCEVVNSLLGPKWEPAKVYLTEYPFVAFGEKPAGRDALLRELQQGALIFGFFGHGDGGNLTREGALTLQTVPQLNNGARAPFCFFGSCSVGRWDDFRSECIAEDLTRLASGGAIATVGAAKATAAQSNLFFAQRLFSSLVGSPDSAIGRAFIAALPTTPIYHLFGDPATRLPVPETGGTVSLGRDTISPGRTYGFGGQVPFARGAVSATLFGPQWMRTYRSTNRYARPNPITYVLAGPELFRGSSRVSDGLFAGGFTVPTGLARGVRSVADGSYIEVNRSTRLSLVADGGRRFGLLLDAIVLDSAPVPTLDSAGPTVTLYADGRRLDPGAANPVRQNFTLKAVLEDSSGIRLSPMQSGDALYCYLGDFRERVSLRDRFEYDLNSHTRGSAECALVLDRSSDSLVVAASDNLLNRSMVGIRLTRTPEGDLGVDQALVYPNPVTGPAVFSFRLTVPASVKIRIYTLSGRVLREIAQGGLAAGYNQLGWDGRDREGGLLPNGVYLYTIAALSSTVESGREQRREALVRERFAVRR